MKILITSLLCLFLGFSGLSQGFPEGIPFQAQIFSQSGGLLSNASIGVRFNIRQTNFSGPIVWQEDHTVVVNDLGHFSINVGTGASTGAGSVILFSDIDWSSGAYFIELLVDEMNTSSYNSVMTQQFMAVPYAYHSKTSSQQYALSQLQDVDTTGIQVGHVLKWNGSTWVSAPDDIATSCDTVDFANSSQNSVYADTAVYALNCISTSFVDSSNFAFYADTTLYAYNSGSANQAQFSNYSDTADVSLYSLGNWGLLGNSATNPSTNFLGTTDSVDLVFKSYGVERMRIKANGRLGFGTSTPLVGFHVMNTNGVAFTGTHGTGSIPVSGAGSRMMWYPGKSAFRAGYVASVQWDNGSVGQYSFAAGYNTIASGMYSVSFGQACSASGEGSFAAGKGTISSGLYSFAAGENPEATGNYGVAIGRGGKANALGAVAIGYHPEVYASYGLGLGNYVLVTGSNAVAMGYHSHALHPGSFVFSDESVPTANTPSTAANQFLAKASGGFIFYTNSTLTTGVTLPAGGGSWSTLSDRNSKENIVYADPLSYLSLLDSIDVYSWNYKSQDSNMIHIGPMAQDFYEVFKFGTDSTTINSGDFDGLNLVLLKALYIRTEELRVQNLQITELNNELLLLQQKRKEMEFLLLELEKKYQLLQVNNQDQSAVIK